MRYNIGIDTGGTYTDAVIYDRELHQVVAKAKARTTKQDLSVGISEALDGLPEDLLHQVRSVVLSTTLATNACVEGKGSRAKLVLMGTNESVLRRIDSANSYGLDGKCVLCLPTKSSFDGKIVDHPDWQSVIEDNEAWLSEAQSLAVCEMNAVNNGAACERRAVEVLHERFNIPVVMAADLAKDLNMMQRGATALLNARLLPVIEEFLVAVAHCLEVRGIDSPALILRSDGGLMSTHSSARRPVETILSGPAASVCGGFALAEEDTCLIIDMGGTTTDIALVDSGKPQMDDKTKIGSWFTQVEGVRVDTFGLGGDSRVVFEDGKLALSTRRVEPLCAAVQVQPELLEKLEALAKRRLKPQLPLFEALYLVKQPPASTPLSAKENELVDALRQGPLMLSELDVFTLDSERLESEGFVMRCGFTPTDAMHIRGDFDRYDPTASALGASYIAQALPCLYSADAGIDEVCRDVYRLVEHRLYIGIAKSLFARRYPDVLKEAGASAVELLLETKYAEALESKSSAYFDTQLDVKAALVGLGAPIHVFLPKVAELLRAECIIPSHAEVANAVGAATAKVSATASIQIKPIYNSFGIIGYTVHSATGVTRHADKDEAFEEAIALACKESKAEAIKRGAPETVRPRIEVEEHLTRAGDGQQLDLGTIITGHVEATL